MEYLLILPALGILLLAYMLFEAGHVEIKRINLTEGDSGGSGGLTVMAISDLHLEHIRVPAKKVRQIIEKEKIDVLLLAGDYFDRPKMIPKFLKYIKELRGKHRLFLIFGNHDYTALLQDSGEMDKLVRDIEKFGIEVLLNQSCPITRNGKTYNIIGIDDLRSGRANIKSALESRVKPSNMDIAFAHNPDTILLLPNGAIDFMVSGHFHGGQVWMPFKFEFVTLRNDVLCKKDITRGMHEVNGIKLYITRGLGNVVLPLRFLSRPEISIFKFS